MKLIISPKAEPDLSSIGDFIAQNNPARAACFVRELQLQCRGLLLFPEAYRLRPELGSNIGSMPYQQYVVFYQVNDKSVRIVCILNAARDVLTQVSG